MSMSRLRRRWLITIPVSLCTLALLWVTTISLLVLFPNTTKPPRSDVVVSLSPSVNRLPPALELMEAGVADNLVISFVDSDEPKEGVAATARTLCDGDGPFRAECFHPDPLTTLGEALGVRELVRQHGWTSVTVVTNTTHAFRAGFIFRACLGPDVTVDVVAARLPTSSCGLARRVAYENAALLKAIAQTRTLCHCATSDPWSRNVEVDPVSDPALCGGQRYNDVCGVLGSERCDLHTLRL